MDHKSLSSESFYKLVKSADLSEVNRVSEQLIQRMALYLTSVLNADDESAKDCAQEAYEKVYVKILENSLSDIDDIFGYLIRSAKNEYLMKLRKDKFEVPSEHEYFSGIIGTSEEEVVYSLYTSEKEKLLELCIEQLTNRKQSFFQKVLQYINEKDKVAADKLDMTPGSFRTRKSRVIEALRDCVKRDGKI